MRHPWTRTPEPSDARWTLMVRQVRGLPPPPLPPLPGRVVMARDPGGDPVREQWDEDVQLLAPGWWWTRP